MTREEITEKLRNILASAADDGAEIAERATEDSELAADLGLSSIGVLLMVIAIEERFGIKFGNVRLGSFRTVGDVVDYIQKPTAQ